MKKKIEKEKSLERSFNRLENKVKNQEALDQALSRMEKKAAAEQKQKSVSSAGGQGRCRGHRFGQPGRDTGGRSAVQIYHAGLRAQSKNWVLPEGLLKQADISADVAIRISRNGKIEDVYFERKSGVVPFDQEVIRTLQKSDPLPPIPEGYPRNTYEVVLTFHSKDLGGN